ncbi:hypothetical protein ACFWU5_26735 [Nocardia sp. NPDC058640]|uniref:hypothetical protein n=1 Tax=Nocardia sp. NPDC058640 TaxID=3346571 RepID=UPI00364ECB30
MTSDDAQSDVDAADKPDLGKSEDPIVQGAAAPSAAPRSKGRLAAGLAGVVAVGAIAAAVVFFVQDSIKAEKLDAIAESTKAACDYAAVLVNYDSANDLDGYITAMKAGATGDFLKEFSDASEQLGVAMVQAQLKSTGEDVQCGYLSGGTDDARAMVTMTQIRSSIARPEPERMLFPIEMSLVRSGDKWLVSRLDSPLLEFGGGAGGGAALGGQPVPTPGN